MKKPIYVFRIHDHNEYIVAAHKPIRLTELGILQSPVLQWLQDHKVNHAELIGDVDLDPDYGDDFFLVYSADCAFPPFYVTQQSDMSEALDEIKTETNAFLIDDVATVDYDDDSIDFDDNGRPMDMEAAHVLPLHPIAIFWEHDFANQEPDPSTC